MERRPDIIEETPERAAETISDALDFLRDEAAAAGLSDVSDLIQEASAKSRAHRATLSSETAHDNVTRLGSVRQAPAAVVRRRWSRHLPLAAAAALAAIAVTFLLSPEQAYEEHFQTAIGQHEEIQLPDGSRISLNTNSELTVSYSDGERRVDLARGEAHFDVTPAPERPFSVAAGAGSVRAVGTAFNVYLMSDAVEVTVTEGTVEVLPGALMNAGNEPTIMVEGQQLEYRETAGPIAEVDQREIAQKLAWQDGMLDLEDLSLAEIIEEASRYLATRITVDPKVENVMMRGIVKAGDLDALLKVIEANESVTASRVGSGHIQITAAMAPNQ